MRDNRLVDTRPDAYHQWAEDGTRPWTEMLVTRVEADAQAAEGCILDIGMGTAHLLLALAQRPRLCSWRFIGLDIDPRMVAFAAQRVCAEGQCKRITLLAGDVHQLPFRDGVVDRVVGRSIVHHWSDPRRGFREIHRVLSDGGRALVHEPLRDADDEALTRFNASRRAAGLPDMSHAEKYTADEIAAQLAGAGLGACSVVLRGEGGISRLGCEIRVAKDAKSRAGW